MDVNCTVSVVLSINHSHSLGSSMTLLLHFPLWNTSCCLPSKLPYSNLPPSGVSITKDLVVARKAPVMVVSLVIEILSLFSILNGVLVWVVNDIVPVAPTL